ncbi:hypothetical protein ACFVAJ_17215 [Agromyces sp. NPDC057679]|uniref:hypothetical protein n=1 Tax=Agromyces sp. NPDC057679 TaxID=3346207 RepID=UPI00366A6A2D
MTQPNLGLEQLGLEQLGLELRATPSIKKGDTVVDQCAQCGTLVVWPPLGDSWGLGRKKHLDLCPSCEHPSGQWWRQRFPVGPVQRIAGATPVACAASMSAEGSDRARWNAVEDAVTAMTAMVKALEGNDLAEVARHAAELAASAHLVAEPKDTTP